MRGWLGKARRMVGQAGLEPATVRLKAESYYQLSY